MLKCYRHDLTTVQERLHGVITPIKVTLFERFVNKIDIFF